MSSLSKKGKLGGKKLSTNEQLLALQDALTLGVSELQLAAWRLGEVEELKDVLQVLKALKADKEVI